MLGGVRARASTVGRAGFHKVRPSLGLYVIQVCHKVGCRNGSVGAMTEAIRDVCEFMHSQPGHPKKREARGADQHPQAI